MSSFSTTTCKTPYRRRDSPDPVGRASRGSCPKSAKTYDSGPKPNVDTGAEFPLGVASPESGRDGMSCEGETLSSDDSARLATSVNVRVTRGKVASPRP